jgi:hypothetical protein
MARQRPISLRGMVVELDWDDDGRPTAFGLETDRETYALAESRKSEDLAAEVGRRVRVTGVVSEAVLPEGGDEFDADFPTLAVESYELLDEDDEDDDEEEDEEDDSPGYENDDADDDEGG